MTDDDQTPAAAPLGGASRKALLIFLGIVLLACLGFLEARTPEELSFGVFYYFPVVLVTWVGGARWGCFAACLAALAYLGGNWGSSAAFNHVGYRLWTTLNELIGESFLVFIVVRLRRTVDALDEQRRFAQKTLSEVRTLEEMLPVCAWCKQVRDDQGYWNQLESYLTKRRLTRFSHGICPSCMEAMRKDHPELLAEDP